MDTISGLAPPIPNPPDPGHPTAIVAAQLQDVAKATSELQAHALTAAGAPVAAAAGTVANVTAGIAAGIASALQSARDAAQSTAGAAQRTMMVPLTDGLAGAIGAGVVPPTLEQVRALAQTLAPSPSPSPPPAPVFAPDNIPPGTPYLSYTAPSGATWSCPVGYVPKMSVYGVPTCEHPTNGTTVPAVPAPGAQLGPFAVGPIVHPPVVPPPVMPPPAAPFPPGAPVAGPPPAAPAPAPPQQPIVIPPAPVFAPQPGPPFPQPIVLPPGPTSPPPPYPTPPPQSGAPSSGSCPPATFPVFTCEHPLTVQLCRNQEGQDPVGNGVTAAWVYSDDGQVHLEDAYSFLGNAGSDLSSIGSLDDVAILLAPRERAALAESAVFDQIWPEGATFEVALTGTES